MQYALIKNCDMNEEMRSDAVDLVISATEKYQANYELAARMVKDQVRTPSWDDVSPPGAAHILWERVRSRLGPSLSSSQDGSREGGRRANAQRVQTRRAFGAAAAAFRPLTNIRSHLSRSLGTSVPSYLVSADGQEVQLELDRGDRAGLLV
jgi:hypothetical protein